MLYSLPNGLPPSGQDPGSSTAMQVLMAYLGQQEAAPTAPSYSSFGGGLDQQTGRYAAGGGWSGLDQQTGRYGYSGFGGGLDPQTGRYANGSAANYYGTLNQASPTTDY